MEDILTTDVLVVGAGPTGLMAANQLARFNIDFIIVDQKSGPTIESRAIAVTARSLEIYEQMGLSDEVVKNGKKMIGFNLYQGGKKKAHVMIGEVGKGQTDFSYMLAYEQSKNETLLAKNLEKQGKSILWNHELIELSEFQERIKAQVKGDEGLKVIQADYLIACDGASSPVRRQLNFSFKGGTYKHKFFVADAVTIWDLGYDQLIISPGDENFCAFLPLKNDQTYRIIGTLPKAFFEKDDITFKDIEDVVKKTLKVKVEFESVNWFSTYKLHHRGVKHFSKGRVFLAGDSAHIHSPAGGQGMNTGLQDAYNLCWKLAFVLKGYAKPELLDTYNEERLPFAKWLLRFTDRGFNLMTSSNWFIKMFRKYVLLNLAGAGIGIGGLRNQAFKVISQTGYSYQKHSLSSNESKQKLQFKAGDRLPYFKDGSIYSLLKDPRFHLIHVNTSEMPETNKNSLLNLFPFPVKLVELPLSNGWKKLGVTKELYILVRPDNYIAFISDRLNETDIQPYLEPYFMTKK